MTTVAKMTKRSSLHRQSLVRTEVRNTKGQISTRYIDAETFELWQFFVSQNYDYQVLTQQPCVWIPDEEQRRHDQVFSHAPLNSEVTKVAIECFDHDTQLTEHKIRFVPTDELDPILERLTKHFSKPQRYATTELQAGGAISLQNADYIAPSWSIPRGFAPVRSAILS
ncbi:MAG: hypothetical protein GKR90_21370 [Pseudomonadales bacterium]|nr:hypothetical protein [Pseudomonadales bacterium]